MDKDAITQTLELMEPADLWPSWRLIDAMERSGTMEPKEAAAWKHGIFELMRRWGLEPDDLAK